MLRRSLLVTAFGFAVLLAPRAAAAAQPNQAEQFVSEKIRQGLNILGNRSASAAQRQDQFQQFLLGIIDMGRVETFSLGDYASTVKKADLKAYDDAFEAYAVAVYQFYFSQYAGQTLTLLGSTEQAPHDFIVKTNLTDPAAAAPSEVDFRVLTDAGKPAAVDVAYSGIWVTLALREQVVSYLAQHGGDIGTLTAHLKELTALYK